MDRIRHILQMGKVYINYLLRRKVVGYAPLRLWIELSSRCNLECRLCVNKDVPKKLKGDMDLGLYKKIIDEIKDSVYDVNLFHRGEPLLHQDLIEIIRYAEERNIKTRIHTNATLLTPGLSKQLIMAGLDLISLSFDGYTKATYEKNRVNAKYEKSLENIINFLEIKKTLKSKKPFTILQVMEFDEELAASDFEKQKKDFLERFKDLPLDDLVIRNPHNWGGLLDVDGIEKVNQDESRLIPCTFPWYSLTIFFNGEVYLCPQDFDGKILLGDLNKDTVTSVFNGKAIKDIREAFKTGKIREIAPCKDCDRIWRKTFMGIPREYLGIFLKDSLRK